MITALVALAMTVANSEPNSRVDRLVDLAWQQAAANQAPNAISTEAKEDRRHQDELKGDKEAGKKYSLEVAKELEIVTDPAIQARLDRIGGELAAIANTTQVEALWGDHRLNPFEYTFHIVQDKDKKRPDDVNAFSLPGGYIYVYKGLIKFAESDDELAGVLAHEIAHAALRHVATLQHDQSKLTTIQIPLILAAIFTGGASAAAGMLQATSLIGTAIGSGWSVHAEEAADYGGFQYLEKSKYDPTGMLTFMERLARKDRSEPLPYDLGIYTTHPPSRDRANSLVKYMNLANLPIRRSRVASSFRVDAKPADNGTVQISFGGRPLVALAGSDALIRADLAATRMNEFFDTVPEQFEVQGGQSGDILGNRGELITLTPEDAVASKVALPDLQRNAIRRIRAALFAIGDRVWDTR